MTGDEIVHHLRAAAIGHPCQRLADRIHEQHAAKMRRRAAPGMAEGDLLALGLQVRHQFAQIPGRIVRAADQRHRDIGDEPDRGQILDRVEGQLLIEGRRGREAGMHQQNRVAVGRCLRDASGADRAAGAERVLDDDVLVERRLHGHADQARDGIARAAGRERHDDGDGFRLGEVLRHGGARRGQGRSDDSDLEHPILPMVTDLAPQPATVFLDFEKGAASRCEAASATCVDVLEDLDRDLHAVERGRHAAIDRRLQNDLLDLLAGDAVVERATDMKPDLVGAVQRGQEGEVEEAARAPVEPGTAPRPRPSTIP